MPQSRIENPMPPLLLIVVLAVLAWSAVDPFDRPTWWMEVLPALVGIAVLMPTRRRFPLTTMLYVLIALHMIILIVGGHYTYARVPLGNWVSDALGLARNHYDRLGHFVQGFVPAMIARELYIRLRVVERRGWLSFLIVCTCLAISAVYELLEWTAAVVMGGGAEEFLGTQGDVWDTQKDMSLAGLGAIVALLLLSRWHDGQLRALGEARQRTTSPDPIRDAA
jgi:putative membrane protein